MNKRVLFALSFLLMMAASQTAYAAGNPLSQFFNCKTLFQSGSTSIGTGNPFNLTSPALLALDGNGGGGNNTFTNMLTIALLLVLLVLSALGIVYGIGLAFGINKLVVFVKTEYAESLANIVIIVIVFGGGFALFNNATIFLSNIAAGAASTSGLDTTNLSFSGHLANYQLFYDVCTNYNNGIIVTNLENYGGVIEQLVVYNVLIEFTVRLMPNGFGFTFSPLYGVQTLRTTIWSEEGISFGIIGMGAMLILTMFVIYFLFPLFFYVGLVLRCFPWTRAAGGSLLAMFIAFYIFFPAILYPFSVLAPANPQLCGNAVNASNSTVPNQCNLQSSVTKIFNQIGTSSSEVTQTMLTIFNGGQGFGNAMFENVNDFTLEIGYSMLQIVGVLIAFIISYDLLEFLGDVLGAPSLSSNRVLSKVL